MTLTATRLTSPPQSALAPGLLVALALTAMGCESTVPATGGAEPATATATTAAAAATPASEAVAATAVVAATTGLAPVQPAQAPGADGPDLALCRLHGAAGDVVDCPLLMTGDGADLPSVAGLQLKVEWDADQMTFLGVASEFCAPGGAGCETMLSPPLKTVGTAGHTLVTSPADPAAAKGALTLMLYHPKKPASLVASATGSLRFRLAAAIPSDAAATVEAVKVDATTPDASPLVGRVDNGKLAIAAPN